MPYIYNPETNLFYQIYAETSQYGDLVSTSVSQSGIVNPGATVPLSGDGLITDEDYCDILSTTIENFSQFLWSNLSVSEYVEQYLDIYYRRDSLLVPIGLKVIVAQMIRDSLDLFNRKLDTRKKSESIQGYSYTLTDVKLAFVLENYKQSLDTYRKISFGYFPLSGD